MISDKERRRIANELREAGAWRGCFRSCSCVVAYAGFILVILAIESFGRELRR